MSETINGWAPPVIFDMASGEKRIATQIDIDNLQSVERAYIAARDHVKALESIHRSLTAKWLSKPQEPLTIIGRDCPL